MTPTRLGLIIGSTIGLIAVLWFWCFGFGASTTTILLLCPTSLLAVAYQGGNFWLSAFFFIIELGGSVALYGIVGLLIGRCIAAALVGRKKI